MKQLKLDHVERLSRGKRSGMQIGSRSVGHHLRPHEREVYHRALRKAYLDIDEKQRVNLWHIWEKACMAQNWVFLVLIKDTLNNQAVVYRNSQALEPLSLDEAKKQIQSMAKSNLKH